MVTADAVAQRTLPQIFLASRSRFSARMVREVNDLDPSCQFWREASGWNSSSRMVEVLEALAAAVEDHRQIILVLDMASCHLTEEVANRARVLKIWLIFIPTHLTFLLQPLDVSVFSMFKQRLQRAHRKLQTQSPDGVISDEQWATTMIQTSLTYIQRRRWATAFERVGVDGHQTRLGQTLFHDLRPLDPQVIARVPYGPPDAEGLRSLFPRRRNPPLAQYLQPVVASLVASGAQAA